MADPGSQSPLLYDYLRKYQEDPQSRVFAPLAEAYRKAGMVREAIEIAREGLRVHPHFVGGRVALARALFDQRSFDEVVHELEPICRDVPDNLVAQRLLAESCLMLGKIDGALEAFKMLLYFTPGDPEVARLVQELEGRAYGQGQLVLRSDPKPVDRRAPVSREENEDPLPEFDIHSAKTAIANDPTGGPPKVEWIRKIEHLQSLLQRVERYRKQATA